MVLESHNPSRPPLNLRGGARQGKAGQSRAKQSGVGKSRVFLPLLG